MKLLIEEAGSGTAFGAWEAASRLRRARHELALLERTVEPIPVGPVLTRRAGDLAEVHALRGYDAVHLASADGIDARRVVVATWNRALAKAVKANGMAVVPQGG